MSHISDRVSVVWSITKTIHYFIIFCKIVKTGTAYAESFSDRTPTPGF